MTSPHTGSTRGGPASRPPGLIIGFLVALAAFLGAVLVAAPLGYLAGKTAEGVSAYAVAGVGVAILLIALLGARRVARRCSRGWRVAIVVYLVVVGFASLGPGIEMLKRSDLGRCPGGFAQCIWPDAKDVLRDLKDEI
jgi:hypothetical protein